MIHGYKCFNQGLINIYGMEFEVMQNYHTTGDITFGTKGNGFHMCERLEDTLRFFDSFNTNIDICEVIGFGVCIKRDDEYNGYYDMYACENMYIIKKMTREEIINYGLNLNELRAIRFVSQFKLTETEKQMFKIKFKQTPIVLEYIDYYQNNQKDAFTRNLKK